MMSTMNHNFLKRNHAQSGQIGLIVILTMVVILTIGLSVASRSSQEVQIASQEENSTRVFNSAESGIEEALSAILTAEEAGDTSGLTGGSGSSDGINRKHTIALSNSLETQLAEGVSTEISLTNNPSGTLNIKWSRQSCGQTPAALLISVFSDNAGTIRSTQYGVNINCNPRSGDNLEVATGSLSSPYYGSYNLTLTNNDQFIRIKPLYNDTDIYIASSPLVDEAQYNIESQAQNDDDTKETSAISAKRTLPTAPGVMDYAIVSGANIVKN